MADPITRLRLYFRYLKKRFVKPGGEIDLKVTENEGFNSYTSSKIKEIQKMINYKGLSEIERVAAKKLIEKNISFPRLDKKSLIDQ